MDSSFPDSYKVILPEEMSPKGVSNICVCIDAFFRFPFSYTSKKPPSFVVFILPIFVFIQLLDFRNKFFIFPFS